MPIETIEGQQAYIEGQRPQLEMPNHYGALIEIVGTTSGSTISSFDVIQLANSNWVMSPKMDDWSGQSKRNDNMGTFKIMSVRKPKRIVKDPKKKKKIGGSGTKRFEKRH